MYELLGELNLVVECMVYANDLFFLVGENSQLELEQRGYECMRNENALTLKVGVPVSTGKTRRGVV